MPPLNPVIQKIAVTLALVAVPVVTRAQTTVTATPFSSVTTNSGLTGYDYGRPNVNSITTADAYGATHSPLARFVSSSVIYPQSGGANYADTNTLTSFLGTDAASLTNSATVGNNTLDGQLMEFCGYLHITSSMDMDTSTSGIQITLGTFSDDGSYVRIGSQTVVDNGGTHAAQSVTSSLTFSSAGYYPIDVRYYEVGGQTGVELDAIYAGGASNGTKIVAPNAILNQMAAPEPGVLALMGAAAPVAGFFLRRRRQA